MPDQKFDGQLPICNRTFITSEHEQIDKNKQDNVNQQHVLSAPNPPSKFASILRIYQLLIVDNGRRSGKYPSQYFNDIFLISHPIGLNFFFKYQLSQALHNCSPHPYIQSMFEFLNNES